MGDDVPNLGPTLLVVLWLMTLLSLIFMLLRLYCKGHLARSYGWDDWVLIMAWLLMLAYSITNSVAVYWGGGKHVKDIPPENVISALRPVELSQMIAISGVAMSKTSFAITLLRTMTSRWQKSIVWFLIVTLNIIMYLTLIMYLVQCNPTAALWDFSLLPTAKCWNPWVVTYVAIVAGGWSALTDVVLALLPWSIVWNLQMKKREKFGVAAAMSLGVFAGVTSAIKTSYLTNLAAIADYTYAGIDVLIWAGVELSATMIASCIPFLRTLVRGLSRSYGRYNKSGSSARDKHSRSHSGYVLESVQHSSAAGGGGKANHRSLRDKFRSRDDLEAVMKKGGDTMIGAGDDQSDKSILNGNEWSQGIKRKDEVAVVYDDKPLDDHDNGSTDFNVGPSDPTIHHAV